MYHVSTKLGDALKQAASVAGLTCITGPMNFVETGMDGLLPNQPFTATKTSPAVSVDSESSSFRLINPSVI